MAKETKSIQVHPSEANSTIRLWENFGWEVLNKQTIDWQTTHQEARGDSTYSVVQSKNYVDITFNRDRNMPNYRELVELENKYLAIPSPPYEPVRFSMLWLIIIGIGLLCLIVPGLLIALWRFKSYSKAYPIWERQVSEIQRRKDEVVRNAQSVLQNTSTYNYAQPPSSTQSRPTASMANAKANFCINCGKTIAPESKFCINCGKQI